MRTPAALLAAVALTGSALAEDRLAENRLEGHVNITVPAGADGPVPAVILFSGCGGVRSMAALYAETANQAGWAAVTVDSHGARGIGRLGARTLVCTGLRLRGQDRAADVFETLEMLRADPRIDTGSLVLAGWSHGGWTILDAMAEAEAAAGASHVSLSGVRAGFLVYPYCGAIIEADTSPIGDPFALTMVLVGRDRIANPDDCRRLAERRRAEGSQIDIEFEPELTHAFDDAEQPWDPRMAYDASGTQRTRARFGALLQAGAD